MTALGSRIDALVKVGATAVREGLAQASMGNLSVRSPDNPDQFIVTSSGSYLDQLDGTTLSRMNLAGEVLDGITPSSEWRLHQQVYRMRPDVQAVVHLHPVYAVIVDTLGKPIRHFTLDHVAYTPQFGRIPFYPNGSEELGIEAGKAMQHCDAIVLGNHGSTTCGPDIWMALRRSECLENAALMTYRMLAVGDETTEFPQELRATAVHR